MTSVRIVLEDGMKLGAKIRSFQSETTEKEDDRVQPLRILITDIADGGRAKENGLKLKDRLLFVDDSPVEAFTDYREVLGLLRDKRPIQLTFFCEPDEDYEIVNKKSKAQLLVERHEGALQSADLNSIRQLAFNGVAERYRPIYWRVLLNYLPSDMSKWESTLERQRKLYEEFKAEFLELGLPSENSKGETSSRPQRLKGQGWWEQEVNEWGERGKRVAKKEKEESPSKEQEQTEEDLANQKQEETEENNEEDNEEILPDPMSVVVPPPEPTAEATKEEKQHELDVELRETIWKDVQRTHPGFHFFADTRCEIMERILFLYAKLNGGLKYVQGMNELVAPILFVFGSSESIGSDGELDFSSFKFEENYEVDTFFCFSNLMGELKDLYMEQMDSDKSGIRGKGEELMKLLKEKDEEVYNHLIELEINPQFFALRWITTLLSREMMLPDTVRLWDSLFADSDRFQFLLHVCCTMIYLQRDNILESDFSGCLQILQKYPPTELFVILETAYKMSKEPGPMNIGTRGSATPGVPLNLTKIANATSLFVKKNFSFNNNSK